MSLINFSEFNTLTQCERKWAYAYVLEQEEEGPKKGLHLGTLCHLWHSNWLLRRGAYIPDSWPDDISPGGKPGDERIVRIADFDPDLVVRALWLKERFVEHYGSEPPSSWNVISAEEWMTRDFPWGTLVGRSDGFVEIDGQLYLIELKTYGKRPGPLAYAQVAPQLGCYSLLAEEKYGQRPDGILMQGIYTYRWALAKPTQKSKIEAWKAAGAVESDKDLRLAAKLFCENPNNWTERDPSESFDQVEVELGTEHLATAISYLRAAVQRRSYLLERYDPDWHPEYVLLDALPNVGRDCSWCGFKPRCWSELGGVEEFEIELDDDAAEPV
jgi:hypothetical protein